jgi:hypothetical protein
MMIGSPPPRGVAGRYHHRLDANSRRVAALSIRRETVATNTQRRALTHGIVDSVEEDRIVLRLSHTDYQVHLKLTVPAQQVQEMVGRRIRGTIEARALKMHPASGGGRFIEPTLGEPRIIAGMVLAVDESNHRVLVDVATPMWLTVAEGQDPRAFAAGGLVNCYLQSGATFTPATA